MPARRRPASGRLTTAVLLAAGVAVLGGGWAVWRHEPNAGAERGDPAALLSAVDAATRVPAVAARTAQLAHNPDDAAAWTRLGNTLMQQTRETGGGEYTRFADAAFRQALALNPASDEALLGVAWVHGVRHRFALSTQWARRALRLDPRNPTAFGLLGDAAMARGDYDLAFEHYQAMLDARPDLAAYSRAAQLLFTTGDAPGAIRLMAKAITAGGPYAENTAWCRAELALMYWAIGELARAERLLERALEQAPDNHHVLAAAGKVQAARQNYPAAIDYYRRAVERAPQTVVLAALGDLYRVTGRPRLAEAQYGRIELLYQANQSDAPAGDLAIARFYADHDRHLDLALAEAERAAQTRADVYTADTLAWVYYKNGHYRQAAITVRKALRFDTPEPNMLFHAGMIYAQVGDLKAARHYLSKALSLNPHFDPLASVIAGAKLAHLNRPAGAG